MDLTEEKRAILALCSVKGIGPVTIERLLSHFGGAKEVLSAGVSDLERCSWLGSRQRKAILDRGFERHVQEAIRALRRLDAWVIFKGDDEYPTSLENVARPPVVLFGVGAKGALDRERSIAIVGSRRATRYGREAARRIARGLAGAGFVVVSGMAIGIDTCAHLGALDAGGKTVAVMGSGIDVPYPRRNRGLMDAIVKNGGAVITEFFPGTQPEPGNFPQRNRLISGLSIGVVVVEAGQRSGSLITASLALEQGKEVMAVPGSVRSSVSKGTHWLIKQGAALVESAEDCLEVLGLDSGGPFEHTKQCGGGSSTHAASLDDPDKAKVLRALEPYPIHIDDLVHITGLDVARLGAVLLELEVEGVVEALPGKYFKLGEK